MDIPGLPARKAALKLLDAVLRRGETLDQAANNALQGLRSPADRALARALSGEVLRWLIDLDALIDSATRQILPDDAKPRVVLRLMLAGWLRLETPPHAVIATGLPLLAGGPRRLAHGVFSTLTKRGVSLPAAPTLPDEVAARWGERCEQIAKGLVVPPPLDITHRLVAVHGTRPDHESLGAFQIWPGHDRIPRGIPVETIPGYDEGGFWVQDIAASIPARLLRVEPGIKNARERVLDLCAAPGGKALQLAARGLKVTALDASAKRLERLRVNLERCHLEKSVEIVCADTLRWQPSAPFDAILLDAPCTATGTCRRHPDVLHRIGANQIAEMAQLQAALLERAVGWLKPGGCLVYAVCSLEPEEGEAQAMKVTLTPDPIRPEELPPGLLPTPEGWLRTDPGMLAELGGLDGFFVARWRA